MGAKIADLAYKLKPEGRYSEGYATAYEDGQVELPLYYIRTEDPPLSLIRLPRYQLLGSRLEAY